MRSLPNSSNSGPPRCPFPRWVGREDESVCPSGHRCDFGNGNIGWAASPPRVLVEGPAGRLKAHFLNELIGALNEGLNVLCCADGAGHDGLIRTRGSLLGTKNRCGKQESEENQEIRKSMLHDGETNKSGSRVTRSASFEGGSLSIIQTIMGGTALDVVISCLKLTGPSLAITTSSFRLAPALSRALIPAGYSSQDLPPSVSHLVFSSNFDLVCEFGAH